MMRTMIATTAALAVLAGGCSGLQARSILSTAGDAVLHLSMLDGVEPEDTVVMATALDNAADLTADPKSVDLWVRTFQTTSEAVLASLEAHDVDVPEWIIVAIRMVGSLCQSLCALRPP